jgi:alkylresorcinol/alkylpyrone synthase
MARVISTATASPPHTIGPEQAQRLMLRYIERLGLKPEPALRILRNTMVEHRHSVLTEEELLQKMSAKDPMSTKERNDRYILMALELGERVAARALRNAGLSPADIDSIITVSCTGWMLPSLDGHLINKMKFPHRTRRLPITELGCAAGAVGLARAREQLAVYPHSRVLLISVELPSLTFQPDDDRMDQVVSTMIFADGAAAVVLDNSAGPEPHLLDSQMFTVPGTLQDMGYDLADDGLHIVLTEKVPYLLEDNLLPEVLNLLSRNGADRAALRWWAMHPAGPKVLYLIEDALGLSAQALSASWAVLKDHGNMSSAAVLFVLDRLFQSPPPPGRLGMIAAFGPGVSGELLLARWE